MDSQKDQKYGRPRREPPSPAGADEDSGFKASTNTGFFPGLYKSNVNDSHETETTLGRRTRDFETSIMNVLSSRRTLRHTRSLYGVNAKQHSDELYYSKKPSLERTNSTDGISDRPTLSNPTEASQDLLNRIAKLVSASNSITKTPKRKPPSVKPDPAVGATGAAPSSDISEMKSVQSPIISKTKSPKQRLLSSPLFVKSFVGLHLQGNKTEKHLENSKVLEKVDAPHPSLISKCESEKVDAPHPSLISKCESEGSEPASSSLKVSLRKKKLNSKPVPVSIVVLEPKSSSASAKDSIQTPEAVTLLVTEDAERKQSSQLQLPAQPKQGEPVPNELEKEDREASENIEKDKVGSMDDFDDGKSEQGSFPPLEVEVESDLGNFEDIVSTFESDSECTESNDESFRDEETHSSLFELQAEETAQPNCENSSETNLRTGPYLRSLETIDQILFKRERHRLPEFSSEDSSDADPSKWPHILDPPKPELTSPPHRPTVEEVQRSLKITRPAVSEESNSGKDESMEKKDSFVKQMAKRFEQGDVKPLTEEDHSEMFQRLQSFTSVRQDVDEEVAQIKALNKLLFG